MANLALEKVDHDYHKEWSLALNQFEILCGDFKYELLENDS